MNKTASLRNLLALLAIASTVLLPFSTRAHAQDLQARGLKARVGATRTELKNGAAKNVNLWAVLIGLCLVCLYMLARKIRGTEVVK